MVSFLMVRCTVSTLNVFTNILFIMNHLKVTLIVISLGGTIVFEYIVMVTSVSGS